MHKTTMYKQGNGWIVRRWDENVQCYREGNEVTYWIAKAAVGTDNCRNPKKCTKLTHNHLWEDASEE